MQMGFIIRNYHEFEKGRVRGARSAGYVGPAEPRPDSLKWFGRPAFRFNSMRLDRFSRDPGTLALVRFKLYLRGIPNFSFGRISSFI